MNRWLGTSFLAIAVAACTHAPPQTPTALPTSGLLQATVVQQPLRTASADTRAVAAPLADYTDTVLFSDLWRRPALALRDRSLVTMSSLIANGQAAQLTGHLNLALDNGVKPSEIAAVIRQLANYDGLPHSVASAIAVAKTVLESRGRGAEWAAAPTMTGPSGAAISDDPWRRKDLKPRDRSIVLVSAYVATGNATALKPELARALRNGVTKAEISELITHLAFYSGWPRAMTAVPVIKAVFADPSAIDAAAPVASNARLSELHIIRRGAGTGEAGGANFTGEVSVGSRFQRIGSTPVSGALVTFQPGSRSAWHSHPLGQILIVTSGVGWVQVDGGPREEIREGDVVEIPAGARHWHGATSTSAMTHLAIAQSSDGKTADWMEGVPDTVYRGGLSGGKQ